MRPTRRLFPRQAEREHLAGLRRRLRALRALVLEQMRHNPEGAVDDVRQRWSEPSLTDLIPVARRSAAFSSNAAVRETVHRARGSRTEKARLVSALHTPTRRDQEGATVQVSDLWLEVGANGIQLPGKTLLGWAADNVRLISGLEQDVLDQIAAVVAQGVVKGASTGDLRKQIAMRFQVAESRARTIARDQVGTLNRQITQMRHQALGVGRYRWSTSDDERVRPEHEALDDTIRSWDDPHPTEGHPGDAINCRCVAIPVFDDEPQTPAAVAPGTVRGRRFTQAQGARDENRVLMLVDTDKVDREWAADPEYYIEPGTGGKVDRFARWLEQYPDKGVEASMLDVDFGGTTDVGFTDGRHRFAHWRDLGLKQIPVSVDRSRVQHVIERYGGQLMEAAPRGAGIADQIERLEQLTNAVAPALSDRVQDLYFEASGRGSAKLRDIRSTMLAEGHDEQAVDEAIASTLNWRTLGIAAFEDRLAALPTLQSRIRLGEPPP